MPSYTLRSAARHLGIAQPAITRSIRELEHELGAALFVRHVNGVVLTPMGEAFLRRATAIQLELEPTKDEIQQLRGIKDRHRRGRMARRDFRPAAISEFYRSRVFAICRDGPRRHHPVR